MSWNKALPNGDLDAAQLDDDVRTNNDALEAAVDLEHYFATGGTQHGRHKFAIGDTAARAALANVSNGMVFYNTDALAGFVVLQVRQAGAWVNVSVLDTTIARYTDQGVFLKPQFATWESISPSAGNLAIDFNKSPKQYVTLSANVAFVNPVNVVAGAGSTIELDVTIGGAGGWTITWGTNYRAANLLRPVISTVTGQKTRVYISSTQDAKFLVSTLPNFGAIP